MNKQINQRRQTVLLATLATIFIFGAFSAAFAQGAVRFKVGDRVMDLGKNLATVLEVGAGEQKGSLRVKYDDSSIPISWLDINSFTLLDANDKPVPVVEFKVGDRVKVTRSGSEGDEYLQPCTITKGLVGRSYEVRCDPWGGFSYMDYRVFSEWIHPWSGATVAPQLECSFDAPAGTVSKTSAPSAQLFKRVIYERMADDVKTRYGAKVRFGLQFTTFQMGTPFKNVMTGKGLLRDSVPQNAMFYPVKAQYKECREVPSDDYNRYRVTKMNFGCYKDSFGDWVCGTDSTPEFLDQQDVPKKQ